MPRIVVKIVTLKKAFVIYINHCSEINILRMESTTGLDASQFREFGIFLSDMFWDCMPHTKKSSWLSLDIFNRPNVKIANLSHDLVQDCMVTNII